ncbi:hypothetical protein H5410_020579 [Solanum commersonii]|uniref:Uncharacterized protein n=1 Tax=Solanum commersonii TaxID=4109 RepID=A0A9J5Z9G5_SOLCO|nr:hypothetical protein H5410_020579 [Solanum commersonii]
MQQCETVGEDGVKLSANWDHGTLRTTSVNSAYEGHMFLLFITEQVEAWPEKDICERTWI